MSIAPNLRRRISELACSVHPVPSLELPPDASHQPSAIMRPGDRMRGPFGRSPQAGVACMAMFGLPSSRSSLNSSKRRWVLCAFTSQRIKPDSWDGDFVNKA